MRRSLLLGVVVCIALVIGSGSAAADEWRIPVGLAYISGMGDIVSQYEDNLEADGYVTDSVNGMPLGIIAQPYFTYDSGLGFGMGLGPVILIYGDADFFNLPINACVRYTLKPKSNASIYFRGGLSYNISSGDYVENSNIGLVGAVGVELMRNRAVGLGFEIGYDSASIKLEHRTTLNPSDTEDYKPVGLMISIFAVF